jgi:hypothetical protein
MSAALLNLLGDDAIEQGVPYSLQINHDDGATPTPNPINLTGWSFVATLTQACGGTFSAPFTATVPTPTNGVLILSLTASQTAALPATPSGSEPLRIDVLGTNADGVVMNLVTGKVFVRQTPPTLL